MRGEGVLKENKLPASQVDLEKGRKDNTLAPEQAYFSR